MATGARDVRRPDLATGTVVFDNGAAQPIGGGSIQIHP